MTRTITTTSASSTRRERVPTWFGTRAELGQLIETAHSHGLSLIADMVINHNSGADAQEVNPITESIALDSVQSEERKVPAQLGMFSSVHV